MTVMGQLNTLESAGLIRLAQYEPDLEYLFRHALVQDAAYASLLDTDRKRLHRLVGEAVERLYADRLDEYAAMLARHFERAGDDQHALEYFICAGDAALAAYANQEAESQYRSALALTCSEAQRATLLAGLGEALYRQSRIEEAIQTWREGIELHQALGDRGWCNCGFDCSSRETSRPRNVGGTGRTSSCCLGDDHLRRCRMAGQPDRYV